MYIYTYYIHTNLASAPLFVFFSSTSIKRGVEKKHLHKHFIILLQLSLFPIYAPIKILLLPNLTSTYISTNIMLLIHIYVHTYVFLQIHLHTIQPSIYLSIFPSIYLFIHLSIFTISLSV